MKKHSPQISVVVSDMWQRLFDLVLLALCGFPAALLTLLIGLAIRVFDGAPVLWCQMRIGRGMRPFRLYKLRTMKETTEHGYPLTIGMDPRVTPLGYWLRKYHLNELPQLYNILIGDMSFIGPRPEVPEFVDTANPIQRQVLQVVPGLVDDATLHWLHESQILDQAENWEECYRQIILPDKLNRSLLGIQDRSLGKDLWLLIKALVLVLAQ